MMIYVAGKYLDDYKNPTREGTDANIALAEKHSIELVKKGYAVITPHKNTAGYEQYEDGSTITWQTWLDMDFEIIRRCDAIYMLPNWESSKGAKQELALAQKLGLKIWGYGFSEPPAPPPIEEDWRIVSSWGTEHRAVKDLEILRALGFDDYTVEGKVQFVGEKLPGG